MKSLAYCRFSHTFFSLQCELCSQKCSFVCLCAICLSRLCLPIIMTSKIQLNPKGSDTFPCISIIKDRICCITQMIESEIGTSLHCLHGLREFTLSWPRSHFFPYNPSFAIQHDPIALPLPFNRLLLLSPSNSYISTNHQIILPAAFT